MPRKARKESSTQIYHIILRGNNRQLLFLNDEDRYLFLDRIFKYSEQLNIEIYSYCLMGNHVHILLGNAPKKNLSLYVQKLANSYVYYFNRKYECSGHLFQGRFKSEPVEDDTYFKTVLRYILQNPEKANISSFTNYKWNSYNQLVSPELPSRIERNLVYKLFDSIPSLKIFLNLKTNQSCMEYKSKIIPSDTKVREILEQLLGVNNLLTIKSLSVYKRKKAIAILRKTNFSISQISRITGLSKKMLTKV